MSDGKYLFKVGDRVSLLNEPKHHGIVVQVDDYNKSGMVYIAWDSCKKDLFPYYMNALVLEPKENVA